MAQRRNSHLLLQPRSAAVAQTKGNSVEGQIAASSRSQSLFNCLRVNLSAINGSLWASVFGGIPRGMRCSRQAEEVLAKLDEEDKPLQLEAPEVHQISDDEEEDFVLPRKRPSSAKKCQPEKRQKSEVGSLRRTLATQTQKTRKIQTDVPKFKTKELSMPRFSPPDIRTLKELSLMKFAMRLSNFSSDQLRKGHIETEFSREYEATLPFYRRSDEPQPKEPQATRANLASSLRSSSSQEELPTQISRESEQQEEVDSCTTTPEHTPEKPKVADVPLLKLQNSLESDAVKAEKTLPSKPEISTKPFIIEEESKTPIFQQMTILPPKPSEPELAHPVHEAIISPTQISLAKDPEVKPSMPDNPFLKPSAPSTEVKLPYVFGSAAPIVPQNPGVSNPFLSTGISIPPRKPVTESSSPNFSQPSKVQDNPFLSTGLSIPPPKPVTEAQSPNFNQPREVQGNPFLSGGSFSMPFKQPQTDMPSNGSTAMEVDMIMSPTLQPFSPPTMSFNPPAFSTCYPPMMQMPNQMPMQMPIQMPSQMMPMQMSMQMPMSAPASVTPMFTSSPFANTTMEVAAPTAAGSFNFGTVRKANKKR